MENLISDLDERAQQVGEKIDGDVVFYTNPGGDPKATTMEKVTGL